MILSIHGKLQLTLLIMIKLYLYGFFADVERREELLYRSDKVGKEYSYFGDNKTNTRQIQQERKNTSK